MKKRLDQLLVERGMVSSRERAKAAILSGDVRVNGSKVEKPGAMIDTGQYGAGVQIKMEENAIPYVSRGGLKLEKALSVFSVLLTNRVCMDIGASTGGFTDCMLRKGAGKVYAIDVGRGQLAGVLRGDERVIVMEKTNFRYLVAEDLDERPDFAAVDVSFISLEKILPSAYGILSEAGEMICLIKPQFEAGRDKVGKRGVVKGESVQVGVIDRVVAFALGCGFGVWHLDYSPVKGAEGNVEYLLHLMKEGNPRIHEGVDSRRTVEMAFERLR